MSAAKPQTLHRVDEVTWITHDERFIVKRHGSNTGRFAVGYSYELRARREEYPFGSRPRRRNIYRVKLTYVREALRELYAREAKEQN